MRTVESTTSASLGELPGMEPDANHQEDLLVYKPDKENEDEKKDAMVGIPGLTEIVTETPLQDARLQVELSFNPLDDEFVIRDITQSVPEKDRQVLFHGGFDKTVSFLVQTGANFRGIPDFPNQEWKREKSHLDYETLLRLIQSGEMLPLYIQPRKGMVKESVNFNLPGINANMGSSLFIKGFDRGEPNFSDLQVRLRFGKPFVFKKLFVRTYGDSQNLPHEIAFVFHNGFYPIQVKGDRKNILSDILLIFKKLGLTVDSTVVDRALRNTGLHTILFDAANSSTQSKTNRDST